LTRKNTQFIDEIINSRIIEILRKKVPQHQLAEFDKYVEEKLAEYNEQWLKMQPNIQKYEKKK